MCRKENGSCRNCPKLDSPIRLTPPFEEPCLLFPQPTFAELIYRDLHPNTIITPTNRDSSQLNPIAS